MENIERAELVRHRRLGEEHIPSSQVGQIEWTQSPLPRGLVRAEESIRQRLETLYQAGRQLCQTSPAEQTLRQGDTTMRGELRNEQKRTGASISEAHPGRLLRAEQMLCQADSPKLTRKFTGEVLQRRAETLIRQICRAEQRLQRTGDLQGQNQLPEKFGSHSSRDSQLRRTRWSISRSPRADKRSVSAQLRIAQQSACEVKHQFGM